MCTGGILITAQSVARGDYATWCEDFQYSVRGFSFHASFGVCHEGSLRAVQAKPRGAKERRLTGHSVLEFPAATLKHFVYRTVRLFSLFFF